MQLLEVLKRVGLYVLIVITSWVLVLAALVIWMWMYCTDGEWGLAVVVCMVAYTGHPATLLFHLGVSGMVYIYCMKGFSCIDK